MNNLIRNLSGGSALLLLVAVASYCFAEDQVAIQDKPVAGFDIRAQDAYQKEQAEKKKAEREKGAKEEETKEKAKKAKKKAELPSGYEDAPEAGDAPRAMAAEGGFAAGFAREVAPDLNNAKALAEDPNMDVLKLKVDPNVLTLEKQYLPQFQRLVTVERSLMLRACQLNEKQQSKIVAASERCAKVAARRYSMGQHQMNHGRRVVGGAVVWGGGGFNPNSNTTPADPREQIKKELLFSMKESLTPEQQTRYAEENQKQRDHLKRITILNLVVLMDKRLILTTQQREELTESLSKNWNPYWIGALQYLASNNEYLPQIPDKLVVNFLNDEQKVLWQGIQKVQFSSWGNFGLHQNGGIIDDKFAVEKTEEVDDADVDKEAVSVKPAILVPAIE